MSRFTAAAIVALTALFTGACESPRPQGIVLVSLPGLRADALGCYGSRPSATPFLDRLAQRSTQFERAFAPSPSSLVSHLSLVTGLEPPEHGVSPPLQALSGDIPTLAERFSDAGYRTASFTSDGFISKAYGFDRGFDRFVDPPPAGAGTSRDAPTPFDRAEGWLAELAPGERFFLSVHSRVVENARVTQGSQTLDRYTRAVRHADEQLGRFFDAIERLGHAPSTTIIVTADHGMELGEHGAIGHRQLYPETLRVPLLVVRPAQPKGSRSAGLARAVDVAATLYELARVRPPSRITGRSLVAELDGQAGDAGRAAYAEVHGWTPQRSLVVQRQGRTLQLVESAVRAEPDGTWVTRSARFDAEGDALDFRIVSFAESRAVTVAVDGEVVTRLGVGRRWSPVRIDLPPGRGRHRVEISTDDCTAPRELGNGNDPRCLSFKVQGLTLRRTELFDLDRDPGATSDLTGSEPALTAELSRLLAGMTLRRVAAPERLRPSARVSETLAALGYLDGSSTTR